MITRPEIAVDGSSLGRGLNNDQVLAFSGFRVLGSGLGSASLGLAGRLLFRALFGHTVSIVAACHTSDWGQTVRVVSWGTESGLSGLVKSGERNRDFEHARWRF